MRPKRKVVTCKDCNTKVSVDMDEPDGFSCCADSEWNDLKAESIKDLVQAARPNWSVNHEYQACVSVCPDKEGLLNIWFGGANTEVGGDVHDFGSDGDALIPVGLGLHRDADSAVDIAKAIISKTVEVDQAVARCIASGWLQVAGAHDDKRLREYQLELEMKIGAVMEHLQDLEEIWAPLTGPAYLAVMGHAAKRFGEMVSHAASSIPTYLELQVFMEVKD